MTAQLIARLLHLVGGGMKPARKCPGIDIVDFNNPLNT